MQITFESLTTLHFPLLLQWLEAPHVKAWWDQDVTYTLDTVKEKYGSYVEGYKVEQGHKKAMHAYIFYIDAVPVGYVQLYDAYDFARSVSLIDLPKPLAAFDIFIGESDCLHKGIGSKVLEVSLEKLLDKKYTNVFADPDVSNSRAIRAYEKAGFKIVSQAYDATVVWMIKKRAE